ncbi:MAG: SpoIIE family protein phosphatase [Rhodomicrobium sp.]
MGPHAIWRQSFTRELAGISQAARWLDGVATEIQLPGHVAFAMQVCLEEVFSNIVYHGEPEGPAGQAVVLIVEASGESLRMIVEDGGQAFDLTQAPAKRITQALDEIEPGGLGIVLIKSFSSGLSYERAGDRNRLTVSFAAGAAPMSAADPEDEAAADKALSALKETLKLQPQLRCEPGEILVRQGEASDKAFFLSAGSVLVYSETSYGTVPLATLHAPRLIGEIGVLAGLPRTASVRAAGPATVIPVSKAALLDAGEKAPELLLSVIAQLGRQIGSVNKAIGLYTNALAALEQREFDSRILADLKNPTPELAEFAATFRRFADQIRDKRRQHDEMASAALIQQSLLPKASVLEGLGQSLDLYAEVRPARHVGGDFYDFFMLDRDRLVIAIGDVCGKGIPASLFMAIVVTVLRTAAREEGDVASTVARANTILCMDNESCMFATMFYGVLNCRTGHLEYCNCGHLQPFLLPAEGALRALPGAGLPLALFSGRVPQVFSTMLETDDRLLLFTDGITEAASPLGEEFGEERLQAAVESCRNADAKGFVNRIFSAVEAFAAGAEQFDDITCLAIGRTTATRR